MTIASTLPSLGWDEILLRLALAAVLGGAIGVERELRDRYAGLRTHLLVSLGACVFTLVSVYAWSGVFDGEVSYDPTRIAAQVVTGVGFLGAGAIIRQGVTVHGLTTAATLWVAAALGMTAAAGFYSAAIIATLLTLIVLWPLRIVERRYIARIRGGSTHLLIEMAQAASVVPVLNYLESREVQLDSVQVRDEAERRTVAVEFELSHGVRTVEIVNELLALEGVTGARWTR
jgi:putative Mg2+ transporter-C (MgtC) family protein